MSTDAPPVDGLVKLGLTLYEARAYCGLLRREVMTVRELTQITGLPQARAYDVLDKLVARGLATLRPGTTRQYSAVDPDSATRRLVGDHRRQLEVLEEEARATAEQMRPVYREGRTPGDPFDYIEVLRDRAAVGERFLQLQEQTRSEMLMFVKAPFAVSIRESLAHATSATVFRSIYETAAFDNPAYMSVVRNFMEAGEQVRFVDKLPLKLGIIDEQVVMFSLEDPARDEPSMTTIVVQHRSLAAILRIGFEAVWDRALTFEQAAPR